MEFILSLLAGLQKDFLRSFMSILLAYPIAYVHRLISITFTEKNPASFKAKHLLSFFGGIYICLFCIGANRIWNSFICSIVSYAIVLYGGKGAPKLTFLWCMSYLSVCSIYWMYEDSSNNNFRVIMSSACQMMLTVRLTMFAYDICEPFPMSGDKTISLAVSSKTMPTLLEFFGFVYFPSTILTGPNFSFKDYIDFTEMRMFNDKHCGGRLPPSSLSASARKFFTGFLFVPITILSLYYPMDLIITEDYLKMSAIQRFAYMWLFMFFYRSKYYFIWILTEGSASLCGLNYNGLEEDGETPKWDRLKNVDFFGIEFAQNISMINSSWNITVTRWLKNYIYLRVRPGEKPNLWNTLATYLTSAFWHVCSWIR